MEIKSVCFTTGPTKLALITRSDKGISSACLGLLRNIVMRERRQRSQIVFSLLGDFTKAHRWPKVIPEEHGMLACCVEQGRVWVNCCGTFGVTSAAYWWSRLSGALVRLAHGVLGKRWQVELLLFADDLATTAADAHEREGIVMLLFLLKVLGSPLRIRNSEGVSALTGWDST